MKASTVLLVGAVVWLGWLGVAAHLRADAVLGERIRARETVIATLAKQRARVDTTYVTDTLVFHEKARSYNKARSSVVNHPSDTAAVRTFVTVADSTVRACSVALETCERRVAVRDSIIAATTDLLRLERQRRPGFLSSLITKATWVAIGYGVGRVTR